MLHNLNAMSNSSAAEVRNLVESALPFYTDEVLDGVDEIPASLIGNASVMPRRVTKKKIVFLCYRGGKLLGSAMTIR